MYDQVGLSGEWGVRYSEYRRLQSVEHEVLEHNDLLEDCYGGTIRARDACSRHAGSEIAEGRARQDELAQNERVWFARVLRYSEGWRVVEGGGTARGEKYSTATFSETTRMLLVEEGSLGTMKNLDSMKLLFRGEEGVVVFFYRTENGNWYYSGRSLNVYQKCVQRSTAWCIFFGHLSLGACLPRLVHL